VNVKEQIPERAQRALRIRDADAILSPAVAVPVGI
jgi:hypothetical protein